MASLQTHHHHHPTLRFFCRFASPSGHLRRFTLPPRFPSLFVPKARFLSSRGSRIRDGLRSIRCAEPQTENITVQEEDERPPFDINLAVILAGFAFEAYTSPPDNIGRREVDAGDCKTVYLSESFVREIYDGQLLIKLIKGLDLPIMDPWGTSDPYVVMQLDGQVVKSKIKWGNKTPTWNEDFTLNIKLPPTKSLQVAAWDANLVTPHKRMGNASISLESLCDGNKHKLMVDLEGMGGGGKLQLEVEYKSFDEIDDEKKWWKLPFVSEFLRKNGFESAMKKAFGSETVPASQFVEYVFGQVKSFNDAYFRKDRMLNGNDSEFSGNSNQVVSDLTSEVENPAEASINASSNSESSIVHENDSSLVNVHTAEPLTEASETTQSDKHFWNNFTEVINQNVVQKLGLPVPLELKWDGFDLLNKIGLQSQKIAEAGYIESGLATPKVQYVNLDKASGPLPSSLPDIKKASQDLLRQTDSVLGAWMVLTTAVSKLNNEAQNIDKGAETEKFIDSLSESGLDEKKAEEMRTLFSTAETAMEAWAMLATSVGHPSFIKSEFEKICFLDNESTDTEVAIWRDLARKRLVIAFRGTEQAKWKDLRTDLMLVPAGLNPERIGGDFKQEVQVHTGFLSAYDSVRIRIISIIKLSIGYKDDVPEPRVKWHVYVTGHSLGGALATLLALELASSQLAKCGAIRVTMYNFGSPRVGNKRFAEVYNQKVKDSWRIVNHRDIIPTVPRLMGYCHVAQPVYLAAGELKDALENLELLKDGYQGDVIGEATPDVLVTEFMKGEKELIEKILQTEINIFRSIRDGSALMQHMEDFYYITLLENVKSNYRTLPRVESNEQDGVSVSMQA
ncbi:hypothetical protein K2173_003683 [Erythroxylum novogranatense]|uniref:C2 domain-containing protein n=1 Tax=Erythroxylum novogranatense TaxID=1862640 RepID=A0AAV8TAM7_9ROSI|nr:hypothetical protein K2173_003683 [Erythroxylum novogranatense]